MNNMRNDSITGIVETDGLVSVKLHFSEWWNGEGLDFDFNDEKRIALHLDEIHALVVASIAAGFIDIDEAISDADELVEQSKERQRQIMSIRAKNYE